MPDWDEEAIEQARMEATTLLEYDANDPGALLILERARRAEARLRGEDPSSTTPADDAPPAPSAPSGPSAGERANPFDPMRLLARMARYYPSFSDESQRKMPWKRWLGYLREMHVMQAEEEEAMEEAMRAQRQRQPGGGGIVEGSTTTMGEAAQYLPPPPQAYEGPTVSAPEDW